MPGKSTKRLAINTIATFMRSVLVGAISLWASRWVIGALGPSDYGLYCILGSLLLMISFFSSVMSGSVARYLAFSVGKNEPQEITKWFNVAFSIHLIMAAILGIAGWPIGDYIVKHVLSIPPEKIYTCLWIFRISLFSAISGLLSVPFIAIFVAKQHIVEMSIWGILQSLLLFIFSYLLLYLNSNKLLLYAIGVSFITIFIILAQTIRAFSIFEQCKFEFKYWNRFKLQLDLLKFSSWSFFGAGGVLMRDQGTAILLNLNIGPTGNAAYGIAGQISSASNMLAAAMINALTPEITACEGRGDREKMLDLCIKTCSYGTIFSAFLVIPLFMEMDYILRIWLKTVPTYTCEFCRIFLIIFLIDRLTTGYAIGVNAYGKIAGYQATLGSILLLTTPFASILFRLTNTINAVAIPFISTIIIISIGRIIWVKYIFGINGSTWLKKVGLPVSIIIIFATISTKIITITMQESFTRLIFSAITNFLCILTTTCILLLDKSDREKIKSTFKRHTATFTIK